MIGDQAVMVSTGRGLCLGVLLRGYIIWMMTIKAMGCMVLYIIDGSLLMHQEVSKYHIASTIA